MFCLQSTCWGQSALATSSSASCGCSRTSTRSSCRAGGPSSPSPGQGVHRECAGYLCFLYSHTPILPYLYILILSYSHTPISLHSHTLILPYLYILILSYSHISTFSYSHISTFSYSHTCTCISTFRLNTLMNVLDLSVACFEYRVSQIQSVYIQRVHVYTCTCIYMYMYTCTCYCACGRV